MSVVKRHLLLYFNPLMGTLKSQSNGPLYSNTVTDTVVEPHRSDVLL